MRGGKRLWSLAGLAGCAAAAVTVYSAFHADMSAAGARLDGRSRRIDSPYGPIEYADMGSGPVLLVIHGSGGGFDQGLAFAEPLRGEGFRLIAPSRFGYLGSAMPAAATPEMQADALAFLLDRLDVEEAVIFGGSAGALSASQLALRHPRLCRGLVLGVPALYAPERRINQNGAPTRAVWRVVEAALGSDFLFWAASKVAPGQMTRLVLATDPSLLSAATPQERARVGSILDGILPVSRRRAGLAMDSATAGAPPPYSFERLGCPLLAISTSDDLYGTAPAARWAVERAPEGRLILYRTGGHLWVGRDADVWREIAGFARDPAGDERRATTLSLRVIP